MEKKEEPTKKDFPDRPFEWLSQISHKHWIEIMLEIGKFKEASRSTHLVALMVIVTILLLMGFVSLYV